MDICISLYRNSPKYYSTMEKIVAFIVRKHIALVAILLVLGAIPFFWFKPGEVNIGGDSSRLYFYDPLNYLKNLALYPIAPGQTGYEAVSYFFTPFVTLFIILKKIFVAPGLVTNVFHGFMLVTAFLFTYLSIVVLLRRNNINNRMFIFFAACIGGLFYIFAPPVLNWDKAITTHNQIFLNPMIFFLLLKFFITDNPFYLMAILLISFVFSTSFSFISAPALFSFYPFAFVYFFFYRKYIVQAPFRWKSLACFLLLFFAIQAFHLLPQFSVLVNRTSSEFERIFSPESASQGLDYFSSVYQEIRLSKNIISAVQIEKPLSLIDLLLFAFPIIVLVGFIVTPSYQSWRKHTKTHVLLTVIFIGALFFDTANVTNVGLTFYKLLFKLPGFSMFRNFYGQFLYVFIFYYALVIGYSLYNVLVVSVKKIRMILYLFFPVVLLLHGWPFISGYMVKLPVLGSKDVIVPQRVDPHFEKTLEYIRTIPIDAKFLTLPLTDFGYQMLAGVNGGLYIGPSMIGHLTGKNDFMGYNAFYPFQEIIFDRIKHKDFKSAQLILSLLNIRYVFYNSDSYIYDKFSGFPYSTVRKYFPDQQSVRDFISLLNVTPASQFSDKYHIYERPGALYLPSIYVATETMYWNRLFMDSVLRNFPVSDNRLAIYNRVGDVSINPDIERLYIEPENNSQYLDLFRHRKAKSALPHISRSLNWIFYPLVALKERNDLESYSLANDAFIDRSIFYADKRISELDKWKNEIPILGDVPSIEKSEKDWKEPTLLQFFRFKEYNWWEISLVRYRRIIWNLLTQLEKNNASKSSLLTVKTDLKGVLASQHRRLINLVKDSNRDKEEKRYLWNLIDAMYVDIGLQLQYEFPSATHGIYSIEGVPENALYNVFLEREGIDDYTTSDVELSYSGRKLTPRKESEGKLINFGEINLPTESTGSITLDVFEPRNLAKNAEWSSHDFTGENQEGNITLSIDNSVDSNLGGMTTKVLEWRPESYYLISLDYRTSGRTFMLQVYEKDGGADWATRQMVNDRLKSTEWSNFQAIVLSGDHAQSASINIFYDIERKEVENAITGPNPSIEVKNIFVSRILNPNIILRRKDVNTERQRVLPTIEFQKINPTRYKVKLSNVKEAFTLVLSQAFNEKWKLVDVGKDTDSFRGWASRQAGKMLQFVTAPFTSPAVDNVEEEYFGGIIREKTAQQDFLTNETFDTWGKEVVADNSHFHVNGYANGWYIRPENLGGRDNYEFIIEMTLQKRFYGSLAISLITFVGVFLAGIFFILHRHDQ